MSSPIAHYTVFVNRHWISIWSIGFGKRGSLEHILQTLFSWGTIQGFDIDILSSNTNHLFYLVNISNSRPVCKYLAVQMCKHRLKIACKLVDSTFIMITFMWL